MKKAFDQTVRDIKRGVNKKVLKVPGIEQKVLDATSNEPWGPHGSHLADIANASRNYHEYQMIMGVVWKRINDIGKNWRHVYKALTVLEYLVANGSERVIDEIREHAYQISTLSGFQYIDSSGRDQGSNVRKKSQSLVLLVNDKDRIVEVRQKAAANRDKFRNTSATGGMYRPNSYSNFGGPYDDEGRGRDDERNSYGRDSEERYGRDGYRDDNYHGRSRSVDKYNYGSRSRSSDRDREQAYDDDGNSSSRGGARVDESSVEGRKLGRTYSEQNIGVPPSYEEAVTDGQSPAKSERDGEPPVAAAPKPSSSLTSNSPVQASTSHLPVEQSVDNFDEFDPRGSVSAPAPPAPSNNTEVDLPGSLSDSYALALMPTVPETVTSVADLSHSNSVQSFAAATSSLNQSFEDPFGETPFRAIPTTDGVPTQTQNFSSVHPFKPTMNQSFEQSQPVAPQPDTVPNFGYGDNFSALSYTPTSVSNPQAPSAETQNFAPEMSTLNHETDILAGILPPAGPSPSVSPQALLAPEQAAQSNINVYAAYHQEPMPTAPLMAAGGQPVNYNSGFFPQQGFTNALASQTLQSPTVPLPRRNSDSFLQQTAASNMANQTPIERHSSGSFPPQYGATQYTPQALGQASTTSLSSQPSMTAAAGQLALVPQPTKEKFEMKSTVWADTLSRGLVDLNISGAKTNPLNDIGIDFDSLNRKEKRLEKPAATPVTSTITMGKAMGAGSGIGRAGTGAIRPAVNPAMGAGMRMGLGSGMGMGMGGGAGLGPRMLTPGYGGMNQQQMGMGMGRGMNMNMGMGQGVQMPQPNGLPLGTNMSGYNPMMGGGFAPQQQPYVGGYAPQQQQYGSGYR